VTPQKHPALSPFASWSFSSEQTDGGNSFQKNRVVRRNFPAAFRSLMIHGVDRKKIPFSTAKIGQQVAEKDISRRTNTGTGIAVSKTVSGTVQVSAASNAITPKIT
jgi:hypothetical protein